ncbi:MAG: GTP 3',8-cyclase MoaA [Bryobacterales bacterium]|nr:GTP 3',8-cyclase MoaA [Bryobacterales bacterium]
MPVDTHGRALEDLRISVTDRCNFRCTYCMPLDQYDWISRDQILSFEEVRRLVAAFARLGVRKLRITGGEPLLRADLEDLVAMLAQVDGVDDICLTTNGSLLAGKAGALRRAGLGRVTVSVDSLDPATFARMAQRGEVADVLAGISAAVEAGLSPVKLNAVIERGVNDREILDLLEYARLHRLDLRFIEYMDVGNVNQWTSEKLVSKAEILERIAERHPFAPLGRQRGSAPSQRYRLLDGSGVFGVIASVSEPFCGACTRARLTADGRLVTCLFSERGHDLKSMLRSGCSDEELMAAIRAVWEKRTDRYSEERLAAISSEQGYRPKAVRKLEMISLGG